jgi:CBS domain-containing protein
MRVEQRMIKSPKTCQPGDTLSDVVRLMCHDDRGCVVVTAGDGSQRLLGILTDRDICRAAQFRRSAPEELEVMDAATTIIRPCHLGDALADAAASMREVGVWYLPVVDESEQVIGLLSAVDLIHEAACGHVSNEQQLSDAEIDEQLAIVSGRRGIGQTSHR